VCLAIGAVAELDQSAEIQFGGESVLDLLVVQLPQTGLNVEAQEEQGSLSVENSV